MLGFKGTRNAQADRNIMDVKTQTEEAVSKIDKLIKIRKTQTYYFARGMGILKNMEVIK